MKIFNEKNKKIGTLLVALLSTATGLVAAPTGGLPLAGKIIVLDPGHAVKNVAGEIINPGAQARHGALERDVALNVGEKTAALLEAQGAKVFMTRTALNPWRYSHKKQADNRARAIFANSMHATIYVRLHCDWNRSKKFEGFTTYYYRWGSRELGKYLERALADSLRRRDNGIHRRSLVSITAKMPTVLLELGVLSNRKEGAILALDTYQTRAAQGITAGIVDYFQHHDMDAPIPTPAPQGDVEHTVEP